MIKQIQTTVQIKENLVFVKEVSAKLAGDLIRDDSVVTEVIIMFHSSLTKILYVDHMRGRVLHVRWMFQAESEGGGMEQTVKHQTA